MSNALDREEIIARGRVLEDAKKRAALDDLIAKVEAGDEVTARDASRVWPNGYAHAVNAGSGSLDAAKALHEAALPGWDRQIGTCEDDTYEASVARPLNCQTYDAESHDMARAWLLAILRAMKEGKA